MELTIKLTVDSDSIKAVAPLLEQLQAATEQAQDKPGALIPKVARALTLLAPEDAPESPQVSTPAPAPKKRSAPFRKEPEPAPEEEEIEEEVAGEEEEIEDEEDGLEALEAEDEPAEFTAPHPTLTEAKNMRDLLTFCKDVGGLSKPSEFVTWLWDNKEHIPLIMRIRDKERFSATVKNHLKTFLAK